MYFQYLIKIVGGRGVATEDGETRVVLRELERDRLILKRILRW